MTGLTMNFILSGMRWISETAAVCLGAVLVLAVPISIGIGIAGHHGVALTGAGVIATIFFVAALLTSGRKRNAGLAVGICVLAIAGLATMRIDGWSAIETVEWRLSRPNLDLSVDPARCVVTLRHVGTRSMRVGLALHVRTQLAASDAGNRVRVVELDGLDGGDVVEGARLVRELRRHGITTAVALRSCDSTCALTWALMPHRLVGDRAGLDQIPRVHAPALFGHSFTGVAGCLITPEACLRLPNAFWRHAHQSAALRPARAALLEGGFAVTSADANYCGERYSGRLSDSPGRIRSASSRSIPFG